MKHYSKKFLSLLATCSILVSISGCSNSTNTPANTSSESTSKKTEPKTLELWHIQTTDPMPQIYQDSINRFQNENPDYKVNISIIANDAYKQKIAVAMGSGQTPDIYPSWSGGPMNEYIAAGHAVDLTEYMNKDNYKDNFLDAAIAQASYDGKIYGFPVENVSISGIFYNKDLFKQYGLTEPNTLAELESICDTLIANGKTPFSLANKSQWTGSMYYMNFVARYSGLDPFNNAVSGNGSFEDEPFIYAGNKVQEWVDKGYFNQGFNGADEDSGQSRQLLYMEDCAMTVMGSWLVGTIKGENPEFYNKLGFFTFPGIEGKEQYKDLAVGTVGDQFYHISGTCSDTPAAFKVLQSLLDEPATKARVDSGRIPPLKSSIPPDPILKIVMEKVNAAPTVQLWYDQYLPPELGDLHKTTSQELFGKTKTPEQVNKEMQQAMENYLSKH